jgi:hypothetical protein
LFGCVVLGELVVLGVGLPFENLTGGVVGLVVGRGEAS